GRAMRLVRDGGWPVPTAERAAVAAHRAALRHRRCAVPHVLRPVPGSRAGSAKDTRSWPASTRARARRRSSGRSSGSASIGNGQSLLISAAHPRARTARPTVLQPGGQARPEHEEEVLYHAWQYATFRRTAASPAVGEAQVSLWLKRGV